MLLKMPDILIIVVVFNNELKYIYIVYSNYIVYIVE